MWHVGMSTRVVCHKTIGVGIMNNFKNVIVWLINIKILLGNDDDDGKVDTISVTLLLSLHQNQSYTIYSSIKLECYMSLQKDTHTNIWN